MRYAVAACQTDLPNPLDRGQMAANTDRMLAMIDAAVAGSAPFLPVRLVVFPEFAHAAPVYATTAQLLETLAVEIPNEHTERLGGKAREHGVYIQSGTMLERDARWPGDETLAAYQNVATTAWGWGIKTFTSGLTHLEGQSVYACIDGVHYGPYTVSGGAVTLDTPGVQISIGRRYLPELELLDLVDSPQFKGPDNMTPRLVKAGQFEVADAAGLLAGESLSRLTSWEPTQAPLDYATRLFTGQIMVHIESSWNKYGRAVLQQPFCLPVTVVAASREIEVMDPGGGL